MATPGCIIEDCRTPTCVVVPISQRLEDSLEGPHMLHDICELVRRLHCRSCGLLALRLQPAPLACGSRRPAPARCHALPILMVHFIQ
jgi:hypothetical protein